MMTHGSYNSRSLLQTSLLSLSILLGATASALANEATPIAGVKLGMELEEVKVLLEKMKGDAKERAISEPTITTYTARHSDGNGTYVRGLGITIQEYEPGRFGGFGRVPGERLAVVFGEFNQRVISAIRQKNFGEQMPTVQNVRDVVQATYGISLQNSGSWDLIALHLRDKDGQPTDNKNCLRTTQGYGTSAMIIENMSTWTEFFSNCGALLRVTVEMDRTKQLVTHMSQQMADTQAVLEELKEAQSKREAAKEKARQENLSRASKIAPKM